MGELPIHILDGPEFSNMLNVCRDARIALTLPLHCKIRSSMWYACRTPIKYFQRKDVSFRTPFHQFIGLTDVRQTSSPMGFVTLRFRPGFSITRTTLEVPVGEIVELTLEIQYILFSNDWLYSGRNYHFVALIDQGFRNHCLCKDAVWEDSLWV